MARQKERAEAEEFLEINTKTLVEGIFAIHNPDVENLYNKVDFH